MRATAHGIFTKWPWSLRHLLLAAALAGVLLSPGLANSPLPQPTGRVILTVTGAIGKTNTQDAAHFDRQMLEGLGFTSYATSTSWTDGTPRFEGVLARDLLAAVGARGSVVTATGLNDYSIEIPIADFEAYPVLLALKMDGKALSRRDKGPIWIVYPRDEFGELRDQGIDAKWVWQLVGLEIK